MLSPGHEQLCCGSRGSRAVAPWTSISNDGIQDHKRSFLMQATNATFTGLLARINHR